MAVFSNLAGAGTISLTPGVSRLYVDVVVFGNGTSSGMAAPTDYFKLGALRLGIQGLYYGVRYIDGAHIVLDCPEGVTTLGYSCFTTTVITVTEVFNPVPNYLKQPWDRNPLPIGGSQQFVLTPPTNVPLTTLYTVPANRLFLMAWFELEIVRNAAATTVSTVIAIGYAGGKQLLAALLQYNNTFTPYVDRFDGSPYVLSAGMQIQVQATDYEATGQVFVFGNFAGTEFDA